MTLDLTHFVFNKLGSWGKVFVTLSKISEIRYPNCEAFVLSQKFSQLKDRMHVLLRKIYLWINQILEAYFVIWFGFPWHLQKDLSATIILANNGNEAKVVFGCHDETRRAILEIEVKVDLVARKRQTTPNSSTPFPMAKEIGTLSWGSNTVIFGMNGAIK